MYFIEKIKEKYQTENLVIFVDMDGVITDYDLNSKLDFKSKRPLITNINTLKEISKLSNIELHILSICKKDYQIAEKNDWLDKYAPFFKKENRMVISKESNPNFTSKELKYNYLKEYSITSKTNKIAVIDDDNEILKYLNTNLKNIDFYQDSSLID